MIFLINVNVYGQIDIYMSSLIYYRIKASFLTQEV